MAESSVRTGSRRPTPQQVSRGVAPQRTTRTTRSQSRDVSDNESDQGTALTRPEVPAQQDSKVRRKAKPNKASKISPGMLSMI